jgi:hypothetical protein
MNRNQITARLKEPSTWAGLSALGLLFGVPPGTMDAITQVGIALTGAAAVLLSEKGAPIEERRPLRKRKGQGDA